MNEQRIANSEKLISRLALGTVQFGLDYGISNEHGQTPIEEVQNILQEAKKYGVKTIDTAKAYGTSEEVLGITGVQGFDIVSKLKPNKLKALSVEAQIEDSLKKLKVEYLYGVLFHNAQSALENLAAVNELWKLKHKGLVKKVGYSLYTPSELEELLAKYGLPDIIQVPFNILDKRFETQLEKLHKQGVEIHTRSAFLQGLFFMNPNRLGGFFDSVKPFLLALQSAFTNTEMLAGFLLQEVIRFDFIDKVIVGVNTRDLLRTNISGLINPTRRVKLQISEINENILMPNTWPKN